jgi:hypothetical protein
MVYAVENSPLVFLPNIRHDQKRLKKSIHFPKPSNSPTVWHTETLFSCSAHCYSAIRKDSMHIDSGISILSYAQYHDFGGMKVLLLSA